MFDFITFRKKEKKIAELKKEIASTQHELAIVLKDYPIRSCIGVQVFNSEKKIDRYVYLKKLPKKKGFYMELSRYSYVWRESACFIKIDPEDIVAYEENKFEKNYFYKYLNNQQKELKELLN